ncbi:MAG: ABC transporter ATP-binding protein [Cohaesibacteraceae bacterium]|nr:ABC transporter ATP-binding protein [Cohaesibacteraceae bacterium]MBL4876583.1 ABC transporter ATP-binding protein [Cohaesibacteraceae bacterium]
MIHLLDFQNVVRHFSGLVAVDGVSFSVSNGETLGLLGPNGSGKTTLLNMISGALKPTSGLISLNGSRISGLSPNQIAHRGIARTFQLVRCLPSLSVSENVIAALAFGKEKLWGQEAKDRALQELKFVGLGDRANEDVSSLTYIDQKRLELARALATNPDVLLLDEWLAGLNPVELTEGIDLIHSLQDTGTTIILVEHIMEAVRALCHRCIVMNAGRIIADDATAIALENPEVIQAYLGVPDA